MDSEEKINSLIEERDEYAEKFKKLDQAINELIYVWNKL